MNDKAALARGLSYLATGLVNHGRFNEAINLAEEKMRLSQDLGNRPMIAGSYATLALANLHLGRYEQARSQGQMCLRLHREIDNPWDVSYVLWLLGDVSLAEGAYADAEKLLQESVTLHREIGEQGRLYDALASLGYAVVGLGKLSEARQCLSDVMQIAVENQHLLTGLKAICLAALLSVEQGKPEQAVELYALASRYPRVANSRWFEDIAGRHIAAAAAILLPEVVEAARARGQARDLEATMVELSNW
jgi:tetratricopeptide (TPR) repeat protein